MSKYKFNYPEAFTTLPDYSAHRGATVQIVRPLIDGEEYDREDGEAMFRIRCADGWQGDAWDSELIPL